MCFKVIGTLKKQHERAKMRHELDFFLCTVLVPWLLFYWYLHSLTTVIQPALKRSMPIGKPSFFTFPTAVFFTCINSEWSAIPNGENPFQCGSRACSLPRNPAFLIGYVPGRTISNSKNCFNMLFFRDCWWWWWWWWPWINLKSIWRTREDCCSCNKEKILLKADRAVVPDQECGKLCMWWSFRCGPPWLSLVLSLSLGSKQGPQ